MVAAAQQHPSNPAHIPVLIGPLIDATAPVSGEWIDGTFGAGGYARALLEAGARRVIGIDRDPDVFVMAAEWADDYADRLHLVEGTFGQLDQYVDSEVDGVVLDLGVSSMQLDRHMRGFSFSTDGPLDMRMSKSGESAADLVNGSEETRLADILFHYGEERASRRIARAIVAARDVAPIVSTAQLAEIVSGCLPPRRPGQSHPATRSFQAIRIAVNDEFGELVAGLEASERVLKPDGWLAVVSFHSLEDRVVKRFFQQGVDRQRANRYAPEIAAEPPRWTAKNRGIAPDPSELQRNPRARSALLRIGRRTNAPARNADRSALGLPMQFGIMGGRN